MRSKKKRKGEKGKAKKIKKSKSQRTKVTFSFTNSQNFDFSACPSQNVIKRDASGKNGKLSCCKCIFDQLIWPKSSLKTAKMSKKRVFAKRSGSQWVNTSFFV